MNEHVVCTACASVNRVPRDRLGDGPVCGRCREPLLPGRPLNLTEGAFDALIAKSTLPVVVDFWASWCGPCKAMAPIFEKVAATLAPTVVFAKVDTEAQPQPALRFNVAGIPTLILFRNGREASRQVGALDVASLIAWVKSALS